MQLHNKLHLSAIKTMSSSADLDLKAIEKRVSETEFDPNFTWVDLLFKDYPYWDDAGKAPHEDYIVYHSMMLLHHDSKRNYDRWMVRKLRYHGHDMSTVSELAVSRTVAAIVKFTAQFSKQQLMVIGI